MHLTLSPFAKTIPGNYSRQGMELMEDLTPGSSCTPDQWDKAKRMEDPHYDWAGYATLTLPKGDHPEYVARAKYAELVEEWEKVMREKEPLRKGP